MHINEMIVKDGNILVSADDRVWNSDFKNCIIHLDCNDPHIYRCKFIKCTIITYDTFDNSKKGNAFEECTLTDRRTYAVTSNSRRESE